MQYCDPQLRGQQMRQTLQLPVVWWETTWLLTNIQRLASVWVRISVFMEVKTAELGARVHLEGSSTEERLYKPAPSRLAVY